MRKKIVNPESLNVPARQLTKLDGELDIANLATVLVTSEDTAHPIENAFSPQRGAGSDYWAAANPGMQTIMLAFDRPQSIRTIRLEIEETEVERSQALHFQASSDGGQTFTDVLRQEYNFSPSGTTLQQETWTVNLENITHLRLDIKPDMGDRPAVAKITSLALSA
ncbi:MAG: hypothetical protein HC925_03710 [Coleofasciculaceae cyanobacterium SM2_3_26]|nr:hypothetical protein [Coleofasciculaceae cyanobacterium SM2_3_26]